MTRQVLLPLLSLQNISTGWTSYVQTKEFLSHFVSEYSRFKLQPNQKKMLRAFSYSWMGFDLKQPMAPSMSLYHLENVMAYLLPEKQGRLMTRECFLSNF